MAIWMVVEDEPDLYQVLIAMFHLWGVGGTAFSDGREVIKWIDGVDNGLVTVDLPELALIDIRLPNIAGTEIAARIRKSPKLGNIAIALMTAYRLNPNEEAEVIKTAQADTLLYKPLPDMMDLEDILGKILSQRKKQFSR